MCFQPARSLSKLSSHQIKLPTKLLWSIEFLYMNRLLNLVPVTCICTWVQAERKKINSPIHVGILDEPSLSQVLPPIYPGYPILSTLSDQAKL